jgi:hypothetical protein
MVLFIEIIPLALVQKKASYPQNRAVIHIITALIHRKRSNVKVVFTLFYIKNISKPYQIYPYFPAVNRYLR